MATIDQQFVEYIVKTLVNNPDKVQIDRQIDEKGVLLSLTVDPEDVGRVIGRRGATAQSIRTLLRALGTKNDARYNLKIVNTDEEGGNSTERVALSERDSATGDASGETDSERVAPSEGDPQRAQASAEHDGGGEGDRTRSGYDSEPITEESYEADEPTSDLAEKTRAELADYDDLDI